jgi:transcriptional regulator with XRE-family HTH domain
MKGLKLKRIESKMTAKELAKIIGLSMRAIYSYEYGLREPSVETLKRLSEYFKCSIEELL